MNLNFDKILCVFPLCGNTHILVGNFRQGQVIGLEDIYAAAFE